MNRLLKSFLKKLASVFIYNDYTVVTPEFGNGCHLGETQVKQHPLFTHGIIWRKKSEGSYCIKRGTLGHNSCPNKATGI